VPLSPPVELTRRFRSSLHALVGEDPASTAVVGLAVSGGPDSVAMLLLAAAALPGRVLAATVDHRLRPKSAGDATLVAALCRELAVPHTILPLEWNAPAANRQALAREARYARLGEWAAAQGAAFVATGHQLDDQAETLLMRLNRGAGVGGLAGVRERRLLARHGDPVVELIRPLLSWRRAELRGVVEGCGVALVDDPSNADPAHDRTAARAFLEASPHWPDRTRVAASARYLGEAERALDWAAAQLLATRQQEVDGAATLDVTGVPRELRRRLLRDLIRGAGEGSDAPRGAVLARALEELACGRVAMLGGVVIRPTGERWRFEPAPPRRS
jgi:tRNA(Ile)-lysidine synthase